MALGTFPIQSTHSAASEWVKDGESAMLVEPTDINAIANKIIRALKNDKLVDSAAIINWNTISKRLNYDRVKTHAIRIYLKAQKNIKYES